MYIQDIHSCPLTIISSVLWLTYFTKSYYFEDSAQNPASSIVPPHPALIPATANHRIHAFLK